MTFDPSTLLSDYQQVWWTGIAYWLFNGAVQSLPAPALVNPNQFYVWLYNFLHFVANNFKLINKESERRTIVRDAIQGTGDGTVKQVEKAVEEAKHKLVENTAVKLDEELTVDKVKGAA